MAHKTQRLVLKATDIDIGIVPVVKWLTNIDGVFTYYSCEGRSNEFPPCVQFVIIYLEALDVVVTKFKPCYGDLRVIGSRDFEMRFTNTQTLKNFIEEQL